MEIWSKCDICGRDIPVGELCYGLKKGNCICKDCCTGFENYTFTLAPAPTLTPPNEPLIQSDLDVMDYDKVWIDYGDDGEWALVVSGRIYALAVLEGAGFEDILRDEVGGETMDRPSGNYTVYRCPPEAKDNNVPTNEPLTIEELREMNGEPVEGIRGEWMFPIFADQEDANDHRCQCSECGSIETPLAKHRF